MRDRLIGLLQQADKKCNDTKQCENCIGFGQGNECVNHLIADRLLANGVIVPPCKIDQKTYVANNVGIRETTVSDMYLSGGNDFRIMLSFDCDYDCEKCPFSSWSKGSCGQCTCGYWEVQIEDFGKTVFLTREDAEKALAERSEG